MSRCLPVGRSSLRGVALVGLTLTLVAAAVPTLAAEPAIPREPQAAPLRLVYSPANVWQAKPAGWEMQLLDQLQRNATTRMFEKLQRDATAQLPHPPQTEKPPGAPRVELIPNWDVDQNAAKILPNYEEGMATIVPLDGTPDGRVIALRGQSPARSRWSLRRRRVVDAGMVIDAMTDSPKRRWLRFSLRTMLVATALIATVFWALLETQRTEKLKADVERLRNEKDWLKTQVRTQNQLMSEIRAMPATGARPASQTWDRSRSLARSGGSA